MELYFRGNSGGSDQGAHIKLKYKNGMDVTMYSYLNKESTANVGACIQRAGLYDIAIKDEWIYPKSGVIFHIKKA